MQLLPLSLRAMEKHVRRNSMRNRFMTSVAAAALIAGTGFAYAQGTGGGMSQGGAARQGGAGTHSAAPSPGGAPPAAPTPRDTGGPPAMKSSESSEMKGAPSG